MSTGEIEIIAKDLTILNTSKTTPFKVNDDSTNEDLRLQYRYVDLRSTFMQQNLRFRSKLFNVIRNHLNDQSLMRLKHRFLQNQHLKEREIILFQVEFIKAVFLHYHNHHNYLNKC